MSIDQLSITNFRNISQININPAPRFNIFYGQNASGKTSLLEAIYYLGLGRSFRTYQAGRIIQHNTPAFSIFAQLKEDNTLIPMGIERELDGSRRIRMDGEALNTLSLLAKKLPLQLISTESYRYFCDGPKPRRQFLNWGVFHVEQCFYPAWQQLQQTLKQRNAALKNKAHYDEIRAWDAQLGETADTIDHLRSKYVGALIRILYELLKSLLGDHEFKLIYSKGWRKNESLEAILKTVFYRDLQLGYTQHGPQRADLQLFIGDTPAQDYLSQGQQKLASYALRLAQGLLMQQETGKSPIYLIDDLPSELDIEKRHRIIDVLLKLEAQIFITGIDEDDFEEIIPIPNTQLFHVEQGNVSNV